MAKIYTVVETISFVEVLALTTFADRAKADIHFAACERENSVCAGDIENEAPGTVAISGDDAYAVQLFETELD